MKSNTKKQYNFSYQVEQDKAEVIFQQYYALPENLSLVQKRKSEKEVLDSLEYLVNLATARYKRFNNYQDQRQQAYLAIAQAMKTYNPKKSNSFTYWASRYMIKVRREAEKERKWKSLGTKFTLEVYNFSSIDLSSEQKVLFTWAINQLTKKEINLLINCGGWQKPLTPKEKAAIKKFKDLLLQ